MNELDRLFLELLGKYDEADSQCIWERSGTIQKDLDELKVEIEAYRARYEQITGRRLEALRHNNAE